MILWSGVYHTSLSQGYFTSGMIPWTRTDTVWWSRPLAKACWCAGGGPLLLRSIIWSCIQNFCFGGGIPPYSNLYFVQRSVLYTWTGGMKIFDYLSCKCIPWSCVWTLGTDMLPCPLGFPHMRSPLWGWHNIHCITDPKNNGSPDSIMGEWPTDLGDEPRLVIDHLVNLVHGPGSVLIMFPDWYFWVFSFGSPCHLVVITK